MASQVTNLNSQLAGSPSVPVSRNVARAKSSSGLLRSFVNTGLIRFLSSSGTMVLSIVLARTMSKEQFGLYSFCMVTLVSLSMLARYGLDSVLLRFGGSAWHAGDMSRFRGYAAWATRLTIRNALAFTVVGLAILYCLGSERWEGVPIMAWLLIALTPWSLLYTISFIFKAAHRTPTGSLFEVGSINHLAWITVLALVFYETTITANKIAAILLVCAVAVCAIGFFLLRKNDIWPTHTHTIDSDRTEFLHSCRSVVVICVMQMFANLGGIFFLGLTWSNDEVAVFSAPVRLATATILLTNVIMLVIAPRLSGLHKAGETEKFKRTLKLGCLAVFAINVPILLTLAITAPWVMMVMPKYVDYWHLLSIISVGQMIGIIAGLAPTVLCMTGSERMWSKAVVCNSAVCIVLTAILCYFYGALGAAIGSATYQASLNWVAACLVRWRHGFWTVPQPLMLIGMLRQRLTANSA